MFCIPPEAYPNRYLVQHIFQWVNVFINEMIKLLVPNNIIPHQTVAVSKRRKVLVVTRVPVPIPHPEYAELVARSPGPSKTL